MSWIAAATVASAAIGASSAKSAAGKAQKATDASLAEQARQYDLAREDQAPYREAGYDALERLGQFTDPSMSHQDVMNEPGYQFGLQQGLSNIQNTAAARGGLYSGNALKALTQYGNDYASSKYNDAWNRMQSDAGNRWGRMAALAGIGQTATNQTQQAGQNYANASSNLLTNNATMQGGAGMMRGNIMGNALNQFAAQGSNTSGTGWFGGRYGGQQQPQQPQQQPSYGWGNWSQGSGDGFYTNPFGGQ
jgi:hypothetical protein